MSFHANVVALSSQNEFFRRVVFTGSKTQLVIMCLKPGEEIGEETHNTVEQILFNFSGTGKVIINDAVSDFNAGDVVVVTPGDKHNFINTGTSDLKIYTIYSPANHIDGRIQNTKLDATNDKEDHEFGE